MNMSHRMPQVQKVSLNHPLSPVVIHQVIESGIAMITWPQIFQIFCHRPSPEVRWLSEGRRRADVLAGVEVVERRVKVCLRGLVMKIRQKRRLTHLQRAMKTWERGESSMR